MERFITFCHEKAVSIGIFGTIASTTTAAGGYYFIQHATSLLAFFGALFGAASGLFTLLIVFRRWRAGKHGL